MIITHINDYLRVQSYIHFDENYFCGRPYVILIARNNTIGISIRDDDDFDKGVFYQTDTTSFETIVNELINWMYDHEQGISSYINLENPFQFFPDLNCKRSLW